MAAWLKTEDDLLKKLHLDGLRASLIAERIPGRTRNSVIGRTHRLGLVPSSTKERQKATSNGAGSVFGSTRTHGGGLSRSKKVALKPSVQHLKSLVNKMKEDLPPTASTMPVEDLKIPQSGVDIMALTPHQCRYPLTTELPHLFCGADGYPYCDYHRAVCYAGLPKPRQIEQRMAA